MHSVPRMHARETDKDRGFQGMYDEVLVGFAPCPDRPSNAHWKNGWEWLWRARDLSRKNERTLDLKKTRALIRWNAVAQRTFIHKTRIVIQEDSHSLLEDAFRRASYIRGDSRRSRLRSLHDRMKMINRWHRHAHTKTPEHWSHTHTHAHTHTHIHIHTHIHTHTFFDKKNTHTHAHRHTTRANQDRTHLREFYVYRVYASGYAFISQTKPDALMNKYGVRWGNLIGRRKKTPKGTKDVRTLQLIDIVYACRPNNTTCGILEPKDMYVSTYLNLLREIAI